MVSSCETCPLEHLHKSWFTDSDKRITDQRKTKSAIQSKKHKVSFEF